MKKFLCYFLGIASLVGAQATSAAVAANTQVAQLETSRDSLRESVSKQFQEFVKGSKEMMNQYDGFINTLNKAIKEDKGLKAKDLDRILDAACFAAECHQHQTRKNAKQTPYVSHPIAVAESVVSIGKVYDADVIIAALLHETIDDTHATFSEIRERFGTKVESIVREVTEDKSLSSIKRKKIQIIQAPTRSEGASVVQMADQLFNLNNLLYDAPTDWPRERIDQYFQWSQSVVDNLPEASKSLKDELHRVIKEYWKKQA
ncbi:MAG: bifunctional (p)ppGpp synthetase/guanosine-3',5'-bis(diphosphate) 3'-pyrophosphohydrolase [Chlamydiae bacterium]|nr:bifunctional (p)ppGpp synthetase/guanosine-3',5'-bis(diphosphate) 3'-pyrophosphohydrolase [Chlamydiota bacterium]